MHFVKLSKGCLINLESIDAISTVYQRYEKMYTFIITSKGKTLDYFYDTMEDALDAHNFIISKLDDIGFVHVQK